MQQYKNVLILIVISIIGGGTGVFFKISLKEIPPDLLTFLRFIFAFIFLIPFFLRKEDKIIKDYKKLILISLVAALNVIFFIIGFQHTTIISSSILYAAVPLIVGVLSSRIIKEKISFKKWLGIIVGFIGLLVIIIVPVLGSTSILSGSLLGNAIVLLAVFSFSLYSVLSKKYENEYSPIILTKYFILTTIATQIILMSFHLRESFYLLGHITTITWLSLMYSGILGTSFYYLLYQYVIKKTTPVLTSMTFYLQPIAAVIWAKLFFNEKLTPALLIGGALIFLGITIVFEDKYSRLNKV